MDVQNDLEAPAVPDGGRQRVARAASGFGMVVIAQAVNGLLKMAIVPLFTRMLPISVLSNFVLLASAAPALVVTSDLGCGTAVVRELAEERDPRRRKVLVATLLASRIALTTLLAIPLFATTFAMSDDIAGSIRIGIPLLLCFGLRESGRDVLRGMERYGAAALCQLSTMLTNAAPVFWVLTGSQSLVDLVLALLVAGSIEVMLVLALIRREMVARPSFAEWIKLVKFGFPVAAYFVSRTAGALDRHVLSARTSRDQAGMLQVASTPAGALELLEQALFVVIEPFVYGTPEADRARAFERVVRLAGFALLASGAVLAFGGPEVMRFLAPEGYSAALAALAGLTFAAAGRSLIRVIGLGAGVAWQPRIWAISGAVYLALSLPIVALLAPSFGLLGVAVTNVVAAVAGMWTMYSLVRRSWSVALPVGALITTLVIGSLLSTLFASDAFGLLAPLWARMVSALAYVAALALLFLRRRPGWT